MTRGIRVAIISRYHKSGQPPLDVSTLLSPWSPVTATLCGRFRRGISPWASSRFHDFEITRERKRYLKNTVNGKRRGDKRERISINVFPEDVEEFAISITNMAERRLRVRGLTPYSRQVKLKGNNREFGLLIVHTLASASLE